MTDFTFRESGERTPLTEMNFWRSGCLIPLRCALRFWLWLVWFFDLAMVCGHWYRAAGGMRKSGRTSARCYR